MIKRTLDSNTRHSTLVRNQRLHNTIRCIYFFNAKCEFV